MARDRDNEVDASSELEDLNVRRPEPLEDAREEVRASGRTSVDDAVDLSALTARSKNARTGDEAGASSPRAEPGLMSRGRGWLPLAIGIGVGVVATVLVTSLRPQTPAAPAIASERPPPSASDKLAPSEPTMTPLPPSAAEPPHPSPPPSAAAAHPDPIPPSSAAAPPDAHPVATPPSAVTPHPNVAHSPPLIDAPVPRSPPPSAAGAAKPDRPEPTPDNEEARLAAASVRDSNASDTPLDDMLDDAFTHGDAKAHLARSAATPAAVPVAPTRDDVMKAMTVLVPAIRGCAQGHSGLATAAIVVRNDGKVDSVHVTGQPFEDTANGRCMEGVVRRARFPRFQQPAFRVQFPFSIQ
ncbi:MAG TPA: hypothetical protein VHZ95_13185 [Polyangiales bacterium]|nr:hypothetical protein [Polyangiales bacterium]